MTDDIAEVYELESPEQMRVAADSTRQRILHVLVREARTVTQLGELLDMAPARAHYHVRELARVGLVRLVETRDRGGILEKYYRAMGRTLVVAPRVLRGAGTAEQVDGAREILHSLTTEIITALQRKPAGSNTEDATLTMSRAQVWVTPEEWQELVATLQETLERVGHPRGIPGEQETTFVLISFPVRAANPAPWEEP